MKHVEASVCPVLSHWPVPIGYLTVQGRELATDLTEEHQRFYSCSFVNKRARFWNCADLLVLVLMLMLMLREAVLVIEIVR